MDKPKYCSNCGSKIKPGNNYCSSCGKNMSVWDSDREGESLRAWKRITRTLTAITAVLSVIFIYLIFDRQYSADQVPAPEPEEPAETKVADIPEDAFSYGGNYYYVYETGTVASWEEAREFCEEKGGHLAVITSKELNDFLFAFVKTNGYGSAFFGYSDSKLDGNWRWVTSAQPSFMNWGKNQPNAAAVEEDYAMFSTKDNDGTWNDSAFGYETANFICQWGDEGIKDEVIGQKIPEDAFRFNGSAYYLFDNGITSWHAAQQFCKSMGGDLVVINDQEENEQLIQYMTGMGYSKAYIGFSDRESVGIWKWVSGKRSDFTDWGVGENGETAPYSDIDFAYYCRLNTDLSEGHWDNSDFSDEPKAFICEW